MKMALVTPAPPNSLSGNRETARRWSRLLREAGHKVDILEQWGVEDRSYDMLIALHAWRSAASIAAFANRFPDRALIVVLTGTDIYRFQHTCVTCVHVMHTLHMHAYEDAYMHRYVYIRAYVHKHIRYIPRKC